VKQQGGDRKSPKKWYSRYLGEKQKKHSAKNARDGTGGCELRTPSPKKAVVGEDIIREQMTSARVIWVAIDEGEPEVKGKLELYKSAAG